MNPAWLAQPPAETSRGICVHASRAATVVVAVVISYGG